MTTPDFNRVNHFSAECWKSYGAETKFNIESRDVIPPLDFHNCFDNGHCDWFWYRHSIR